MMITVKDAVRTVVGYSMINIEDEAGVALFNGKRRDLKLADFKGYGVTSIDRDRSTLYIVVSATEKED